MDQVIVSIDFTGQTPAGGGLGYLSPGLHTASIQDIQYYEDSNRIYVYMSTDGVRHRESFNLSEKGIPFMMAFLVSAGVPADKLTGKVDFPFHKLAGKAVYFNYTPPIMNASGQPQEGSYPQYRFRTEGQFNQMVKVSSTSTEGFEVESDESTNGSNGTPIATTTATADDNYDFLLEG